MPRVLVIEDAPATQRLIEMTLMLDGWEVQVAACGESGLEVAENDSPDLVVLDVALPNMDGWHALRYLQKCPGTTSIPIIVVAAGDKSGETTRPSSATAEAFLGKPINLEALRRLARLHLPKAS